MKSTQLRLDLSNSKVEQKGTASTEGDIDASGRTNMGQDDKQESRV
jgi:hypothetical protein